jgi:hypothetical protein
LALFKYGGTPAAPQLPNSSATTRVPGRHFDPFHCACIDDRSLWHYELKPEPARKGRCRQQCGSMFDTAGSYVLPLSGFHAQMLGPATGVADSLQIADYRDH